MKPTWCEEVGYGSDLRKRISWFNEVWWSYPLGEDYPQLPEDGPSRGIVEIWAAQSDEVREKFIPAWQQLANWYDLYPRIRNTGEPVGKGWVSLFAGFVVMDKDGKYKFNEGGKR
jgi:hypothetical protein